MIARVLDFLSEDLYNDFRTCAEELDKLDLAPVLKANWYIQVEDLKPSFGVRVRFDQDNNGQFDRLEGVDNALQKTIFKCLFRFYKESLTRIELSGQELLNKKVTTRVFKAEFQFTDKNASFGRHTHSYSEVNSVLYLYPDESAGTKFYNPDFEAPWNTNSLIVFTDQEHSFENRSIDHRRFTINTFLEVKK